MFAVEGGRFLHLTRPQFGWMVLLQHAVCSVSCKVLRVDHGLGSPHMEVGGGHSEIQDHWISLLSFVPFGHLIKKLPAGPVE